MTDTADTQTPTLAPQASSRKLSFKSAAAAGPVEIEIDGETYWGVSAIPAGRFGAFMEIAAKLGEIAAEINSDAEPKPGEVPKTKTELMGQFIQQSINGLDLVLTDESAAKIAERANSGDNPIDVETLVEVFSGLAELYSTKRKDGQEEGTKDDAPFDDGSASDTGSEPTGGSSEASS